MKVLVPKKGYTHNPMCSYGRNNLCPCGSSKKFKTCCMSITPRYVKIETVPEWKRMMDAALQGEKQW